jgi:GNAT superfamily N-acetyltransferase
VELLPAAPEHLPELGRICDDAFRQVACSHGFEDDFPDANVATKVLQLILGLPGSFGVAASLDGRLVGSNFLLLTDSVAGVGPITVDPVCQGRNIGRRLMEAVLQHAAARGITRVRLLQDACNTTSLSLYASLGFDVREPVGLLKAGPVCPADPTVRLAGTGDLPTLANLGARIYGVSRRKELAAWLERGFPVLVIEDHGRLHGYLVPGKLGHGVAETEALALSLIAQIPRHARPGTNFFFCPLRNTALYRSLLKAGCRLTKIMTLMARGPYEEPGPVWMPSIVF